jgi:hypothetical protein
MENGSDKANSPPPNPLGREEDVAGVLKYVVLNGEEETTDH